MSSLSMMQRQPWASPIYNSGLLDVSDGHRLYFEERGNPNGLPVVLLHGGPGSGFRETQTYLYDPTRFRIIAFDQRGCGRSAPLGAIAANTTADLVADIERLRQFLSIDRWIVSGGSWGVTLALLYAIEHAPRCLGLLLRGAFLAKPREIAWWFDVMKGFFPREWQRFSRFVESEDPAEITTRYLDRLVEGSEHDRCAAALEWKNFERACGSLSPRKSEWSTQEKARTIAGSLIHVHFFKHAFFLRDGVDLDALAQSYHGPCEIVHGRYDVVCPLETAELIKTYLPASNLQIVEAAGHSIEEPGNWDAVMAAAERLARPTLSL